MPAGSEAVVIAGAALMVIDRVCVVVPPAVSVALTMKVYVPAVVGVPEIAPLDELSDRPVGRGPADIDQV